MLSAGGQGELASDGALGRAGRVTAGLLPQNYRWGEPGPKKWGHSIRRFGLWRGAQAPQHGLGAGRLPRRGPGHGRLEDEEVQKEELGLSLIHI